MNAPHTDTVLQDFIALAALQPRFRHEVRRTENKVLKAIGELITMSTETIMRQHVAGLDLTSSIRELREDVAMPLLESRLLSLNQAELSSGTIFADLLILHHVLLAELLR